MKIKSYTPIRPIVLGDFSLPEAPKEFAPLTQEQLYAMQPGSTQKLMSLAPDEPFIISDDWEREVILRPEQFEGEYAQYFDQRQTRNERNLFKDHYYKKDLTTLIHPANVDGTYEPPTHEPWQKALAEKQITNALPTHLDPRFKKEEWKTMSTWEALKHWFRGGKIQRTEK